MDRDKRTSSTLVRLRDAKNFDVAHGDQDIRGWEVRTPDDRKIGKVEELIVDTAERRVRYLDVKVDRKALSIDEDRRVLVPISAVSLRGDGKDVLLERLPVQGLAGVPEYRGDDITPEYEASLRNYYGATGAPGETYRDPYNDREVQNRANFADLTMSEASAMPRLGANEVTVPLVGDQEVVVRRPGSDEEIIIKKNRPSDAERRG
jgi:sporulation protein YlmC with PRC-barrel domain